MAVQPTAYAPAIAGKIQVVREQKVLLDNDLADLYSVPTKVLLQAIKRNSERFPPDFMFQLNDSEWTSLRSQFVTSKTGRGGRRYAPYAFTEQGVAMLSSALGSTTAIAVNIEIMRTFVRMREASISSKELALRLDQLESRTSLLSMRHNDLEQETHAQIKQIFDVLRQLMTRPEPAPKRPIGFIVPDEK
ncbi:DNA-binding protein [Duganella rhizosphaerae]|uniref:ORF6N domain-containing protein n=1 Tax=Duganella rhizosphaerae TaxID=2885763 RepID=UPI0030E7B1B1